MAVRKKLIFLPLAGLLVVVLAVFLLDRTGVLPIPGLPGGASEAVASEQSAEEAEDGKDGKKGKKGKDGDEEEIVPVPVELARVEPRQISAYYRASSFVEADRQVDLVAKVAGRVQTVNVEEGDWVDRGDVLAELDNDREKVMLRQSELKEKDHVREVRRKESLLEKNLVTQDEHEDALHALEIVRADRDLADIALEERIIRAPFDGQVTARHVVPGQFIGLSEPLFTLVDFEPLRVRIHLPEVVARKVRAGEKVEVIVEALADPIPAVVERIAPVVDPSTSTVRLTLLLQADPREIRVGGFVKVRVTTDTHTEALAVPKLALVEEGGLRSVFVAEADSVRKVEVRTGLYDESHCEVLDGLEPGACVVSLGQGGLRPGSRIEVLNAEEVGWVVPEKAEEDEPEGDDAEVALNHGSDGSEETP